MSGKAIFSLGALGGLLPILASWLAIDLAPIIDHPGSLTLGICLGYTIRVVVLIVLGGTMALLNDEVRQPLTLVQLGIAAPALITAYINGTAVAPPAKPPNVATIMQWVTPANAAEVPEGSVVRLAGFLEDVVRGIRTPLGAIIKAPVESVKPPPLPAPPPNAPSTTFPNVMAPPSGMGVFCTTAAGTFGPWASESFGKPVRGKYSRRH